MLACIEEHGDLFDGIFFDVWWVVIDELMTIGE